MAKVDITQDLKKLSKTQTEYLHGVLRDLVDRGFRATEQLDLVKDIVEAAIDWNYQNRVPSSLVRAVENSNDTNNELPTQDQEMARLEEDEFIVLRDPFLSKLYLSWVRTIKNRNLHPNNDWFGINRDYDPFLAENNLLGFIEDLNQAHVNWVSKENKKFFWRQKYAKLIPEFVGHGYTVGVHVWNGKDDYCDITMPGTRNFAIYPITDKMENTTKMFRYEINYSSLRNNPELDQECVKYIKPYTYNNSDSYYTDTSRKELDNTHVKYGLVRPVEINMPSLYLEPDGPEGEPVIAENVKFIAILDANTTNEYKRQAEQGTAYNHGLNSFILAAWKDCEEYETGELIGCFHDTFPEDFPGKGPLIPFLYDQAHLNQLRQAHVRIVSLIADPPYTEQDPDGMDDEDTDDYELMPGKNFGNKDIQVVIPPEWVNAINYIVQATKIIKEDDESAMGMNKNSQGQYHSGRRSATEASEVIEAGNDAVNDVVYQFDDVILQKSHAIRIQKTQHGIVSRVKQQVGNDDNDEILVSSFLQGEKLFQRIKNWSGIEEMYKNFYRDYQERMEQEQMLMIKAAKMKMQIDQLTGQMQQLYQNPANFEQDQQVEAEVMPAREMMLAEYHAIMDSIEGLEEIPQPSNWLYYKMLTSSISQSDIDVVAGTATVRLKEERQTLDTMLAYAERMPEFRTRYDFKKIIHKFAKMLKVKPSEFLKKPAELAKIDKMLKAQEMMSLAPQPPQPQGEPQGEPRR